VRIPRPSPCRLAAPRRWRHVELRNAAWQSDGDDQHHRLEPRPRRLYGHGGWRSEPTNRDEQQHRSDVHRPHCRQSQRRAVGRRGQLHREQCESQTVTVPAGGTATVAFTLSCVTPPGNLTVTTSTSGLSLDLNGYTVTVNGQSRAISINGSVTFTGLPAGNQRVTLSDVAVNCTVTGSNPRDVAVPSGATASTNFTVSCVPGPATRLVYTVQPSNTAPFATITPSVMVKAVDVQGNTVTTYTGLVTIAIGHNAGLLLAGTLSGTKTVSPVNGVPPSRT